MGPHSYLVAYFSFVRLTEPKVFLMTGVAHGYSTSVILQAMKDTKEGKSYIGGPPEVSGWLQISCGWTNP